MRRRIVGAWLVVNAIIFLLYTIVPSTLFNDGKATIAGMPEMLFWFTVLPFAVPALLGALYLFDKASMTRLRAEKHEQADK